MSKQHPIVYKAYDPSKPNKSTPTTGKTGGFNLFSRRTQAFDPITGECQADQVSMEIEKGEDLNVAAQAMRNQLASEGVDIGLVKEYVNPTSGKRYAQANVLFCSMCEF